MSDFISIKSQIQSLITIANENTGNADTDLTSAVNTLINGYGGSDTTLESLEVIENGIYTPSAGVDGFSQVTVNVDPTKISVLKEITISEAVMNSFFGCYIVSINPTPFTLTLGEKYCVKWDDETYECIAQDGSVLASGTVFIGNATGLGLSGNGEPFIIAITPDNGWTCNFLCLTDTEPTVHTVNIWQNVVQEINLQDKTITENGTYTADDGFDGLGSVTVEVAGSGGGNTDIEDSIITRTITEYENNRINTVASYAFYQCSTLTNVRFAACTSVGQQAFCNCKSLSTVSMPTCTYIGTNAFASCTALSSINFPACTTIDTYAFGYCSNLINVSFPECTNIKSYAFVSCSALTTVNFPVCSNIENYAFGNCDKLTDVFLPLCSYIRSSTFYRCSNLTTVSIPSCTVVGVNAFASCSNLTTVSLPACYSIGSSAFINCTALTTIYLYYSTKVCTLAHSNAFSKCTNLMSIYVPASLVASYKAATNWVYYSTKIVAIP